MVIDIIKGDGKRLFLGFYGLGDDEQSNPTAVKIASFNHLPILIYILDFPRLIAPAYFHI